MKKNTKPAARLESAYFDAGFTGQTARYTAFVSFKGDVEEIDVDARDAAHAKQIARRVIRKLYMKGGRIRRIVGPRIGLYLSIAAILLFAAACNLGPVEPCTTYRCTTDVYGDQICKIDC